MRPSSAIVPVALLAGSAAAQNSTSASNCTDGLYIIVARGSGEDPGSGRFGPIAETIAAEVDGSIVAPLDYPATFTNPIYNQSEQEGVQAMQEAVTSYHKSCPSSLIAVLGYSQGGQVANEAFCGGEGGEFSTLDALPVVNDYVAAIITFGDPSHVVNATFNRGTSKKNGLFARDNVTFCEEHYNDMMRAYCDTGDIYCDLGNDTTVHGSYFKTYNQTVVDFVVERYNALANSSGSSGSSSTNSNNSRSTSGSAMSSFAPSLALIAGAPLVLTALEFLL